MSIPLEETRLPAYVLFRGKKARVLGYNQDTKKIIILDSDDQERHVTRDRITFIKKHKT